MIYPNVSSTSSTISTNLNVKIHNVQQEQLSAITKVFLTCQVSDEEFSVDAVLYLKINDGSRRILTSQKNSVFMVNVFNNQLATFIHFRNQMEIPVEMTVAL
jgi:streptomycin 6-kinase